MNFKINFAIIILTIFYLFAFIVSLTNKLYLLETDLVNINSYIIIFCAILLNLHLIYVYTHKISDCFYMFIICYFSVLLMESLTIAPIVLNNSDYWGTTVRYSIPKLVIYSSFLYLISGIWYFLYRMWCVKNEEENDLEIGLVNN